MINYKIGDLVTRLNTINSNSSSFGFIQLSEATLSESGCLGTNDTKVERGVDIPLTKDNYQIICQLIKLGILQDLDPLNKNLEALRESRKPTQIPLSRVKLNSNLVGNSAEGIKRPMQNLVFRMTLISKPGRRIYVSYKDLNSFNFGFQLFLLRTSQGIITCQTALKNKIGGELLLKISFVNKS